jgi:hypothetical protein
MFPNSRGNNFKLVLPKGFFSEEIEAKWSPYVKRLPTPFETVDSYLQHAIQSVSFPSIAMEPVSQTRYGGKRQEYKNSTPLEDLFTRDVRITFKAYDGWINYFIILNNVINYLDFKSNKLYFDAMYLQLLDYEGHIVSVVEMKNLVFTSLSEVTCSYSDISPDMKTFDLSFKFVNLDITVPVA